MGTKGREILESFGSGLPPKSTFPSTLPLRLGLTAKRWLGGLGRTSRVRPARTITVPVRFRLPSVDYGHGDSAASVE